MSKYIAVYLRCSTDEQNVAHQRLAVEAWIGKTGLTGQVREYVDEAISGAASLTERPAFSQLLVDVAAHKVSRIVLFEPSRASRDFFTYIEFLTLCQRNNTVVDVVGRGELKLNSATDLLMQSIDAFSSQHEKEKLAERTKSGLQAARARGVRLGAPEGNTYRLGRRKCYAPDLVALILQLRDAGLTLAAVATVASKAHGRVSVPTIARIERRARARAGQEILAPVDGDCRHSTI